MMPFHARSDDFITAAAFLPGTRLVASAAGSSKERAEEFALRHGFQKAYGSYQELAADKEIDIVYVGNVHPQHRVGMAKADTAVALLFPVGLLWFQALGTPLLVHCHTQQQQSTGAKRLCAGYGANDAGARQGGAVRKADRADGRPGRGYGRLCQGHGTVFLQIALLVTR